MEVCNPLIDYLIKYKIKKTNKYAKIIVEIIDE
jgi:hypothetical protein